jgi:hypothetical protein
MHMMPPGGVRRIDQGLILQTARKVHARESITAILHKFATIGQLGLVSQSQFTNCGGEGREK